MDNVLDSRGSSNERPISPPSLSALFSGMLEGKLDSFSTKVTATETNAFRLEG